MSGRDFFDGLFTCPEEFYRLWCVVVCGLETKDDEAMVRVGPQRHKKKILLIPKYKQKFFFT